jgi:hypothetical protein
MDANRPDLRANRARGKAAFRRWSLVLPAIWALGANPAAATSSAAAEPPPTEVFDRTLRARIDRRQYIEDVEHNLQDFFREGAWSRAALARLSAYTQARRVGRMAVDFRAGDLDGDGVIPVTAEWRKRGVRFNPRFYDRNGDGEVTLREATAVVAADGPDLWLVRQGRRLLALPEAKGGVLTREMVRERAAATFQSADLDQDGRISRDEDAAWRKVHPWVDDHFERPARPPVCLFRRPAPEAEVVLVGAGDGEAGAATPDAVQVRLEPGRRPVYLVLVSSKPLRWRLVGETRRVAWVNLLAKPWTTSAVEGAPEALVRRFDWSWDCVPDPARGAAERKRAEANLAQLVGRRATRFVELGAQSEVLVPSGRLPAEPPPTQGGWSLLPEGGRRGGGVGAPACDLTVAFGSYSIGPDPEVERGIMDFVKSPRGLTLVSDRRWGIEGEHTLCLRAASHAAARKAFAQIRAMIPASSNRAWTEVKMADGQVFRTRRETERPR